MMKKKDMKKKDKDRWVKALRSGDYEQGKGHLCQFDDDGNAKYCCLGVAYEVFNGEKAWVKSPDKTMDNILQTNKGYIDCYEPPGLKDADVVEVLMDYNDGGKSFEWIASYIESYL